MVMNGYENAEYLASSQAERKLSNYGATTFLNGDLALKLMSQGLIYIFCSISCNENATIFTKTIKQYRES